MPPSRIASAGVAVLLLLASGCARTSPAAQATLAQASPTVSAGLDADSSEQERSGSHPSPKGNAGSATPAAATGLEQPVDPDLQPTTEVWVVDSGQTEEVGRWRLDAYGAKAGDCLALHTGGSADPVLSGCTSITADDPERPVEAHQFGNVVAGWLHSSADGVTVFLTGGRRITADALSGPPGVSRRYYSVEIPDGRKVGKVVARRSRQLFGAPTRPDS